MALVFGAFWLLLLAPLGWRKISLWLLFIGGAIVFIPAIALVQLPLQRSLSQFIVALVGAQTYQQDILVLAIPAVLVSGLVQEAAKLIPVYVYWEMRKRQILPKFGLSLGALAGAGFGVFEAQWLLNGIFAQGFNLGWVSTFGLAVLAGFWERFFTVAFHTASGALLGWGTAGRKARLFFLLTTFWHFVLNYTVVLYQTGIMTSVQTEFAIAVAADLIFFAAFLLRWRSTPMTELDKFLPPEEPATPETTPATIVPGEDRPTAAEPFAVNPENAEIASENETTGTDKAPDAQPTSESPQPPDITPHEQSIDDTKEQNQPAPDEPENPSDSGKGQ